MINTVKFAIFVLALATGCLAQEGLTIDNKHKERVSTQKRRRSTSRRVQASEKSSISSVRSFRGSNLFWAPTRTSYRFKDEKSGLPNGIVTPSPRASRGWPLRISCCRNSG
jgi:hypothetical protein